MIGKSVAVQPTVIVQLRSGAIKADKALVERSLLHLMVVTAVKNNADVRSVPSCKIVDIDYSVDFAELNYAPLIDNGVTETETAYYQYIATKDPKTRPAHRLLDGKIFAKDDAAWANIQPPNGYNCRCRYKRSQAIYGASDKSSLWLEEKPGGMYDEVNGVYEEYIREF